MATFSLDTRKPLGRLGLVVQIAFLAVVGLGLASVSHYVMATKLPAGHAQKAGEKAAQALVAAEGGAATTEVAKVELRAKAEAAGKKAFDEARAYGRQTWLPFEVFLAVIWGLMTAGYISVAVQRRLNDAGQNGTLALIAGHVGGWTLMVFCGFAFLLESSGRLASGSGWWIIPIVGGVLLIPSLLGGSGHGEEESH
jgi:hypothetical protein